MQSNEKPIENRFGEAVLENRRVLGISQKALADALSERGLSVDASAISRIEKGARAIRLSEAAIIAQVLGFTLSEVENPSDPKDDFARLRGTIDSGLEGTWKNASQVAEAVYELDWVLEKHPELLNSEWPELTTVTQYVEAIEAHWFRPTHITPTLGYEFESIELLEAVSSLIRNVALTAVDRGKHGKHPEAS
jgi:transcriptional regulator with XRE-family HTH domain